MSIMPVMLLSKKKKQNRKVSTALLFNHLEGSIRTVQYSVVGVCLIRVRYVDCVQYTSVCRYLCECVGVSGRCRTRFSALKIP